MTSNDSELYSKYQEKPHLVIWGLIDAILFSAIMGGNVLTVCALKMSKKLSAVLSNQFIFSLAMSDIMVGLSIPYHYSFYLDKGLNSNKSFCILRFVLVALACSSSIYNLLGTATDRYIAIVYPLHYGRYMTKRIAFYIILSGWMFSITLATVPIYWNKWTEGKVKCTLNGVLPTAYISFVITPMFALVWIAMLILYCRIWMEASGHAKRMRITSNQNGSRYDTKSVQVVLLILGCFSICWLPYFVVISYIEYSGNYVALVYEITFTLAMANSSMNPLIYAWKNPNLRKTFWGLLRCKSPNNLMHKASFITNHVPLKKKPPLNNGLEQDDQKNGAEIQIATINNPINHGANEHKLANTSLNGEAYELKGAVMNKLNKNATPKKRTMNSWCFNTFSKTLYKDGCSLNDPNLNVDTIKSKNDLL